ncbi:hypothetical protein [Legionella saoudiensis]|uniref:hypothetical protein n=1 Tax=Legionella saoudiensis TaxID=1750561 RepID=UPI0007301779|nr:hypothetical protein [Legionella saoudiensis]
MLFTMTLVILLGAIAVFFSQEFLGFIKKVFAVKGVKLFLPLLAASWFVFSFGDWVIWGITYYRELLATVLTFIVAIIPLPQIAEYTALVIVLTVVSVLPVYLIDLYMRKRSYKSYNYPYTTSTLLFIVSTFVLLAL